MNNWRPDNWPDCPCDKCNRNKIDDWGYLCNISCGQRSAWLNQEYGAGLLLEKLKVIGRYTKTEGNVYHADPNKFGWIVFIPED